MEAWLTCKPLTLSTVAVTQEVWFKEAILDPFHGTLAIGNCVLSIGDEAWSWLMGAGE